MDSSPTDEVEGKEIFDSGKIRTNYFFSKATAPRCIAQVDCCTIMKNEYFVWRFFIHPSAKPSKYGHLSGITSTRIINSN